MPALPVLTASGKILLGLSRALPTIVETGAAGLALGTIAEQNWIFLWID